MCWMTTSNDLDDEDLGVAHRRWLLLQVATYPTRWQVPHVMFVGLQTHLSI